MKLIPTLSTLGFGVAAAVLAVQPASAQANCSVVETIGNGANAFILEQVNDNVAGTRQRISRRKKLIIHGAEAVSFDGCHMRLKLKTTLKRKVRRNAHGYIRVGANVTSYDRNRICLNNVRVEKIKLSRTLRIGERFYRLAANKAVPSNQCFDISV